MNKDYYNKLIEEKNKTFTRKGRRFIWRNN